MLRRRKIVRGATDETCLPASARASKWKALLARPWGVERYARISPMVGARISPRRGRAERRRMVATRLFEINGGVNDAGGNWPDELSTPGNASGSLHQKRRMDDSRKISLLRHGNAPTHRSNSADRDDRGRSPDQIGR